MENQPTSYDIADGQRGHYYLEVGFVYLRNYGGWGVRLQSPDGTYHQPADIFEKQARFYLEHLGYLVISGKDMDAIRQLAKKEP